MTWAPELNVIDLSPVIDNLLGYIETNQQDAFDWANGGPGLAPFAAIYPNAAGWLKSIFPYLLVIVQQDEGETGGDTLLNTTFRCRLEMAIMGKADELPLLTRKYDLAVRSMLVNIPSETLCAGMKTETVLWKQDWPASVYDVLRGSKTANSFLQIVQTEMSYIFQTNLIDN